MKRRIGFRLVIVFLLLVFSVPSVLAGGETPPNPGRLGLYGQRGMPGAGGFIPEGHAHRMMAPAAGESAGKNVEFVAQYGGAVQSVAVQGDTAYLGVGPRVEAVDISDPGDPKLVGRSSPLPSTVLGLAVAGDYVYVADGISGLLVLDVSDPTNPHEVGSCDTPGVANEVVVSGSYAYVADAWGGLRVMDISNPSAPRGVGAYTSNINIWGIAVSGGYAYVADNVSINEGNTWHNEAVLRVIDVSNPTAPDLVGSYEYTDRRGFAGGVAVSGTHVYLAVGNPGVVVVDVSDPTRPNKVGTYESQQMYSVRDVAASGSYIYVVGWNAGLRVVDVSDPTNPVEVGSHDTPGWAVDVVVSSGYAYVADYETLRVINVSDPTRPGYVGSYDPPGNPYRKVASSGRYLYLLDPVGELDVVDVGDPSNPVTLGRYRYGSWGGILAASGNYVYLVGGNGGTLLAVDVSDPANPHEVGEYVLSSGEYISAVFVTGDYAYVLSELWDNSANKWDWKLHVLDVSTPSAIHEAGHCDVPLEGYGEELHASQGYVYLGAGLWNGTAVGELQVLDVRDPSNPRYVTKYEFPRWLNSIDVVGSYAYVVGGLGMKVLDVSNPEEPREVGSVGTDEIPYGYRIFVSNNDYAYVVGQRLYVVNVNDPENPQVAGYYPTPTEYGSDVSAEGEYVYVADGDGGLGVYRFVPFADVASDYWAKGYIDKLYNAGITGGCATNPLRYCPDAAVTRAQMAVFLERGLHYPDSYTPPDREPTFPDTAGHWAEDWVEALKADGLTSGYPDGTYRPDRSVTRAEMAVFLLKAKHGANYQPPAVDHSRFSDVGDGYWAKAWIEELAAEGITAGYPDGTYRPDNAVTRAEMSVFLVKTFRLP